MVHMLVSNPRHLELGLLFLRVGIGLVFMIHGWGKLSGGVATWQWMGSQMANFGITLWPTFWGFLAMAAELGGGLCLVLGFATRLVAVAMACVMIVALSYHLRKGDVFDTWSHPFSMLIIFIGLLLAGSGRYSLDHYLFVKNDGIAVKK